MTSDLRADGSGDRWLPPLRRRTRVDLRLFCFPYAGAAVSAFTSWAEKLPPTVELRPVHLPGRDSRWHEPSITRAADLIAALAPSLVPLLDLPFAFFGHSMGALLAFETTRFLRRHGLRMPVHLYVSGHRAPHLPDDDLPRPESSDAAIVEWLRSLNGTPSEVLADRDLMNLVLPSLRADISVCSTYRYVDEPRLSCPITALGGVEDNESAEGRLEAWQRQTLQPCTVLTFPGDHFYLHTAEDRLLETLSASLAQAMSSMGLLRGERTPTSGIAGREPR